MGELKILETKLKSGDSEIIKNFSYSFVNFKGSSKLPCFELIFVFSCLPLFDWANTKHFFFQNPRITKMERRGWGGVGAHLTGRGHLYE